MEHLQRVWLVSRERLPFRTPGSVPFLGLACAPIVETRFLELLDFHLDYPLVLSRFASSILRSWTYNSAVLSITLNTDIVSSSSRVSRDGRCSTRETITHVNIWRHPIVIRICYFIYIMRVQTTKSQFLLLYLDINTDFSISYL